MRLAARSAALLAAAAAACVAAAGTALGETGAPWLVFSGEPDASGTAAAQLFRIRTDGTDLQQITTGARPATDPAFAPNGKQLVFVRLGVGLYRVNLDGTALKKLTGGPRDSFPVWSPDGARIAFLRPSKAGWMPFLVSATGKNVHPFRKAPPSGRPSWTPDGKSVLLPNAAGLAKVDARTGRVQKQSLAITELPTSQAVTVSPSGKTLAFIARRPLTGPSDCGDSPCPMFALYLSKVGSAKKQRVANDTGPAGWSPDGKTLVYVAKGVLTLHSLVSGKTTAISTGSHVAGGDAPPAWSPR